MNTYFAKIPFGLQGLLILLLLFFLNTCSYSSEDFYRIQYLEVASDFQTDTQNLKIPENFSKKLKLSDTELEFVELRFPIPQNLLLKGKNLAINAGRISDVSRFYLNGYELGGFGNIEPYRPGAMRLFLRILPDSYLKYGETNYITVRLYSIPGKFPIRAFDAFKLGTSDVILLDFFINELILISFILLYLIAATYHIFLYFRRRKDIYHIFLALFILVFSSYIFLADSQLRDSIFGNAIFLHRKLEFISLFLITPCFLLFLGKYFRDRVGKTEIIVFLVSFSFCIPVIFGDITLVNTSLFAWQVSFLLFLPFLVFYVYHYVVKKTREGLYLGLGLLSMVIAAINDILVSLNVINSIRITSYSLSLFVFGLIGLLANHFVDTLNRSEELLSKVSRLNLELIKKNIHPHFLMNSIQTAITLVEEDPKKANTLLYNLVDELRETIRVSESRLSSLKSEIEICKNHLSIMSYRKEKEFKFKLNGKPEHIQIPPLSLLTLIENGLSHGYATKDSGLFILFIYNDKTKVKLELFNDSEEISKPTKQKSTGTGFKYVEARFQEAFGNNWRIEKGKVKGGYRVILEFPFFEPKVNKQE